MPGRKNVFLIPGFMSTELGIVATGQVLWWDPNELVDTGVGQLRLAPNGIDPGPPDGVPMGLVPDPSFPWFRVQLGLGAQLEQTSWRIGYLPWDWRKDPRALAATLAQNIRDVCSPDLPGTLVGHSAGGLLAVLAWAQLVGSGQTNLVRRIITLGTPFQGSYSTIDFLAGTSASAGQLVNIGQLSRAVETGKFIQFQQKFLNALALTWPMFYYLMPFLTGSEAANDPNRALIYNAANYPGLTAPSQAWLDDAKGTFQAAIAAANTFPPQWVATYVAGTSISTWQTLRSAAVPMDWSARGFTFEGDGVVTVASALRGPGKLWQTVCDHASLPLGLTINGELGQMILDPRGPPDPPPPAVFSGSKVIINTTPAPEEDPLTGLTCIGGHC